MAGKTKEIGGKKHKYGNPLDKREMRRFSAEYKNRTERLAKDPTAPRKPSSKMVEGMKKKGKK